MFVSRPLAVVTAVCLISGGGLARADTRFPLAATPPDPTFDLCEAAGTRAEQAAGLPPGLLLAIGRIESGRWDAFRRRAVPWPWTINAAGRGQSFGSKDEAVRTTSGLLAGGTRSIDVGCFQINLLHHPDAFASLDEGFNPAANARYAARFLTSLFARHGSWDGAVAAYHSADPTLGVPYRQQVYAAWSSPIPSPGLARQAPAAPPDPVAPAVPLPAVYDGVRVWTPLPRGSAPKIVAMPAPDAPLAGVAVLPMVTRGVPPPILAAARR